MRRSRRIPLGNALNGVRIVLLMGVFACVAGAFWWHFGQRMAALAHPTLQDPATALRVEDFAKIAALHSAFKDMFGIEIYVLVEREHVRLPIFSPGTLFVGVGLARHEAVIVLPSLARRVLGEPLRFEVETNLSRCLHDDMPGPCLIRSLESLHQALMQQ